MGNLNDTDPIRDQDVGEDCWKFSDYLDPLLPIVLHIADDVNLHAVVSDMDDAIRIARAQGDAHVEFLSSYTRRLALLVQEMSNLVLNTMAEAQDLGLEDPNG